MYVAKYYISVKKWIPAINRLKIIVDDYNQTIFIEEALHRLVEIHYHIGLVEEAKKYAKILRPTQNNYLQSVHHTLFQDRLHIFGGLSDSKKVCFLISFYLDFILKMT